jgi:hypothetical protein
METPQTLRKKAQALNAQAKVIQAQADTLLREASVIERQTLTENERKDAELLSENGFKSVYDNEWVNDSVADFGVKEYIGHLSSCQWNWWIRDEAVIFAESEKVMPLPDLLAYIQEERKKLNLGMYTFECNVGPFYSEEHARKSMIYQNDYTEDLVAELQLKHVKHIVPQEEDLPRS